MKRLKHVIAILCSDLHLSLQAPVCRADRFWPEVQARYLAQLRKLQKQNGNAPVICAGDIFDRWNAPPELINFALDHLPDGMICVPGQHDLPNHRIEDMDRSGYGVLVKAGKITDVSRGQPCESDDWVFHGYGWHEEIMPLKRHSKDSRTQIAIIHKYVWTIGHNYPGAPEDAHLGRYLKALKGYDAAVFGDNHSGFYKKLKTGTEVLNCGTFIRRKSDEIKYKPAVGLLFDGGSIQRHYLDTAGDVFHKNAEQREEVSFNLKKFLDGLEQLGEHGLNFHEAVENHLRSEDIDADTKSIVLEALEGE